MIMKTYNYWLDGEDPDDAQEIQAFTRQAAAEASAHKDEQSFGGGILVEGNRWDVWISEELGDLENAHMYRISVGPRETVNARQITKGYK